MAPKKLIKKVLRLDPFSNLTPLKDLIYIGSRKHGYHVPLNFLNEHSICYCVGAGEDISFDTELVIQYGCKVFIFDPMDYAKKHFLELKEKTKNNQKMTIDTGEFAYDYHIKPHQFSNMHYIETGLWDKETTVRFYEPSLNNYAGHSIINLQQSDKYIEAPVDRLSNVMKKLNHSTVDLLKLEIEGAEYTVIETIAEDKPEIKIICVEFDEIFHAKGIEVLKKIRKYSDMLLKSGYKIVHSTNRFKRTYMKKEVYELLKSKE